MAVGFIGLGNLGRAMAGRLRSQGTDLLVWNRTISKAEEFGGAKADTPAAVISACEVVFLNLFDSDAVYEVIAEQNGLLEGDCADKIVIDTTTNHFESVISFHDLLGQSGVRYLEAPVIGSVAPATRGALTIVVSGERSVFDIAKPLLDQLGTSIFFLRRPGLATRMKLVNNLVLAVIMAGLAESMSFAEASGIDTATALEILAVGAGNSAILTAKSQKLRERDFSPHFSVDAIYKDLHYLQDLARELQRPLFTGAIARELFAMARARGMGQDDLSAIYRVVGE